jgi:hypothetical protein
MAATLVVVQNYGEVYAGVGSEVAKNIFYLVPVDDGTASATSNPLRLPESGTVYSYEAYLRIRCDVAPDSRCFNFKVWYNSGTIPSGQRLTVNSDAVSTYTSPINAQSSVGTRVNFTTKNSEGNSIALTGELVDVGDYTSFLVFQVEVDHDATLDDPEVDFIVQWDEV